VVRSRAILSATLAVEPQRIPERRARSSSDTERQIASHHSSVMTEPVEAGLAVAGTASHSPERRRRRNHLRGKVVTGDTGTARVADEGAGVAVVRTVPIGNEGRRPLVDVPNAIIANSPSRSAVACSARSTLGCTPEPAWSQTQTRGQSFARPSSC
jgi:hypothetical protein